MDLARIDWAASEIFQPTGFGPWPQSCICWWVWIQPPLWLGIWIHPLRCGFLFFFFLAKWAWSFIFVLTLACAQMGLIDHTLDHTTWFLTHKYKKTNPVLSLCWKSLQGTKKKKKNFLLPRLFTEYFDHREVHSRLLKQPCHILVGLECLAWLCKNSAVHIKLPNIHATHFLHVTSN